MANSAKILQTIVFADIAGSTLLYEKLGDAPARELVARCLEQLSQMTRLHQGRIIKTIGDEIMGRFDTPDKAARAAVAMQEAISADSSLSAENIQLRIGMHHGDVIEEADDLYGDAVNVAARMAGQAKAGQIITTRHTIEMMSADLRSTARMVDQTHVKGKQKAIEIYELSWGQPEDMTMMGTCTGELFSSVNSPDALLILDLKDQHVSVSHEQPVITMGRDAKNRIVVKNPKVSRLHARIEMRKDKFILTDQSTNGTYICPTEGKAIHLRRDECPLEGDGMICLGKEVAPESPDAIHYYVV